MPVRRPGGRRGRASHRACRPRRPRTGPGRRPGSARASRDKLVRHSCLGPRRRESACQWRLCGEFPDVGSGRDGASRPADRGTDAARRGHTGRLASAGPAYPLPRSTNSWILVRTFASSAQATATYTAMHPGHATLVTKADCLPPGPLRSEPENCPVIDVTVISGPQIPGTAETPSGPAAA